MTTITMSTRMVSWRASGQVGQETLRNSPVVSRNNAGWRFAFSLSIFLSQGRTPSCILRLKRRPCRRRCHLQARQDLNPQPLVLETSALPIELLAYN